MFKYSSAEDTKSEPKVEKKSESQRIASMPVTTDSLEDITDLITKACDRIILKNLRIKRR